MGYSGENYEYLFDKKCGDISENAFDLLKHEGVLRYRTKTIKSGDILEVEIYPVWKYKGTVRNAKAATTREAQKKLNAKNARKKLTRLLNTNFTSDDLCITLTYKGDAPGEEQARKDIRNYIRRIRTYRQKQGLPELKYIYVIEFDDGDTGRKKRIHHHVVLSGMDREVAESLWGKGYANTRRLQPNEYGLEALARYMVKEPSGSKRWCASRNLKKPKITFADTKVSLRLAEIMARDFEEAAHRILTKHHANYCFNDCAVYRSDIVAGVYIYGRMHRSDKAARSTRKHNPYRRAG